jgi:G:T-mismatch repair DNA endonuclease (very short patch repair protein)
MRALRKKGWRIVRIWECQLHRMNWPKIARRVTRLLETRQTTIVAV